MVTMKHYLGNSMTEVELTAQRGPVTTESCQNDLDLEKFMFLVSPQRRQIL